MNVKKERIDGGLALTARLVIGVMMVFFMGLLSVVSLLHTTGMEIVKEGEGINNIVNTVLQNIESVVYYNDNVLANLIWLAVCAAVCAIIMPYLKKLSLKTELIIVGVWALLLGVLWVSSSQVAPSEDSYIVTTASLEFSKGNYGMLGEDYKYFRNFSFQLGYVFFNEILIHIAGIFGEVTNVFFLEFFNVFFLAAAYIGIILINHKLFKDERIRHITAFMLMFCLQPVVFCTFLYGIIPGICFAIWAVYFEIAFLRSGELKSRVIYGSLAAVMIALSVLMKSNNLIVLTAMVIMALVTLFRQKRASLNVIFALLWIILPLISQSGVVSMYEGRANVSLGKSVPFISWVAMGLNESENAPGWYNYKYTVGNYEECGRDADKAGEKSKEVVMDRLKYFSENKQYRNDFFYKKYVSQWNETTYQSLWNNKVRYQFADKSGWAQFACGDGEAATRRYMDIYAMFVFFTATVGIAVIMKKKNTLALNLPLIVLGGILYHLIAEAKSQYALPYFILLVGVSAVGIVAVSDIITPKLSALKSRLRKSKTKESKAKESQT